MEVNLTPDQKALARQAIESGRLHCEEEAVPEALSLWEERERARAEILAAVEVAEASLARGEGRTITEEPMCEIADAVKQRGRARLAAKQSGGDVTSQGKPANPVQWDAKGRPFTSVIFTPGNEPYLGRQSVYILDRQIVECLQLSGEIAPQTHDMDKSDLQWAACHLVPQALSISLSTRELVRQGYLFGALSLLRPLLERITILYYLQAHPEEMGKW